MSRPRSPTTARMADSNSLLGMRGAPYRSTLHRLASGYQERCMAARDIPQTMAERLIVALDVPTIERASQLAGQLDGVVSFFKIGLWLLFAPGAERFIDGLIAQGKRVFLDAKMYDIGETVRQGVARATERGVSLVTGQGDREIMRAAVAGRAGSPRTKVFAISVLTSIN